MQVRVDTERHGERQARTVMTVGTATTHTAGGGSGTNLGFGAVGLGEGDSGSGDACERKHAEQHGRLHR